MRQDNASCSLLTYPCVLFAPCVWRFLSLALCPWKSISNVHTVCSASLSKQLVKKLLLANVSKLIPSLLDVSAYNANFKTVF